MEVGYSEHEHCEYFPKKGNSVFFSCKFYCIRKEDCLWCVSVELALKFCLSTTKLILQKRRLKIPRKEQKPKTSNIFSPSARAWGRNAARSLLLCRIFRRGTRAELQRGRSLEQHLTEGDLADLQEVPVFLTLSEEWEQVRANFFIFCGVELLAGVSFYCCSTRSKGILHNVGPLYIKSTKLVVMIKKRQMSRCVTVTA